MVIHFLVFWEVSASDRLLVFPQDSFLNGLVIIKTLACFLFIKLYSRAPVSRFHLKTTTFSPSTLLIYYL